MLAIRIVENEFNSRSSKMWRVLTFTFMPAVIKCTCTALSVAGSKPLMIEKAVGAGVTILLLFKTSQSETDAATKIEKPYVQS